MGKNTVRNNYTLFKNKLHNHIILNKNKKKVLVRGNENEDTYKEIRNN